MAAAITRDVVDLNKHISLHGVSKKRCSLRHVLSEHDKHTLCCRWLEVRRHWSPFHKARRIVYFVPFASTDDGIAANGTPQASGNSGMEEMRTKLNQSLQGENISSGLVQSIHDAARAIQLAIMEHSSLSKAPWFSKAWLVVDKNAWVKTLSYQVLEKDLAIFGFFIAFGRSTQSFLSANGVSAMDNQIEGIIRYLIGGSVLYYPQLASISSYQLYVEVVCEELEWLPFYQSNIADAKQTDDTEGKQEGIPRNEAISLVLDVCSYWITSFIKYSVWLENPSNIKAARFLSRGHSKLIECMKEVGTTKNGRMSDILEDQRNQGSATLPTTDTELDSFDKLVLACEMSHQMKLNDLHPSLQSEWQWAPEMKNFFSHRSAMSRLMMLSSTGWGLQPGGVHANQQLTALAAVSKNISPKNLTRRLLDMYGS